MAKTQHLLKADGCWLAMKGQLNQQELKQLPQKLTVKTHGLPVPFVEGERHMIEIQRV